MSTENASTELVTVPNPATGELVDLTSPTDFLAARRREVIELKKALDVYADVIDEELTRRLDRMNTRSADVGDWRIEGKPATVTEFPRDPLAKAIRELIAEDKLDGAVLGRTIRRTSEFKVDKREVTKLLKHPDEEVRARIAAVGIESPQKRSVTVKEVGS